MVVYHGGCEIDMGDFALAYSRRDIGLMRVLWYCVAYLYELIGCEDVVRVW
jgi:hypothetical protein